MIEREVRSRDRGLVDRLDEYFRDEKTALAKTLRLLSSANGAEYIQSRTKRLLDLSFGVPAVIITTPIAIGFGLARKFEDGGPIFFVQNREGKSQHDKIRIVKIRTMIEGSNGGAESIGRALGKYPEENPNNTRLGATMRKYGIDEIPQLLQVVRGKMSLVGLRALTEDSFDYLQTEWSEERFKTWEDSYRTGRLAIMSLVSAAVDLKGHDEKRYKLDMLYTKRASLGLDLYLIWKCLLRIARRK